jgi:DNA repair protein RadC
MATKKPQTARSEDATPYTAHATRPERGSGDWIIARALEILEARLCTGDVFTSPQSIREFLIARAGARPDQHVEHFAAVFLNSQNRVIAVEDLFRGTLTQTSVYPREVVRAALRHNAAAIIFTHNHPSGTTQPSRADEALTTTLKSALALVDVRVLDHFITAGGQARSMAEMGLV